jgi:hypothetical protein
MGTRNLVKRVPRGLAAEFDDDFPSATAGLFHGACPGKFHPHGVMNDPKYADFVKNCGLWQ